MTESVKIWAAASPTKSQWRCCIHAAVSLETLRPSQALEKLTAPVKMSTAKLTEPVKAVQGPSTMQRGTWAPKLSHGLHVSVLLGHIAPP